MELFSKILNLCILLTGRSSRPEVFYKKRVLRNFAKFTEKYLCQSLFFDKVAGLALTLAQVFSCEFSEISKNTLSCRTPLVATSELRAEYASDISEKI